LVAILIDSNVLIFSIQQGHPWHEESWNVRTRPANRNGLGLSPEETNAA
jgi:hypothetical protein